MDLIGSSVSVPCPCSAGSAGAPWLCPLSPRVAEKEGLIFSDLRNPISRLEFLSSVLAWVRAQKKWAPER